MALFKINNPTTYRFILTAIQIIFSIIIVLFVYAFFNIMYKAFEKRHDYSSFCYSLFAANAIICNNLFGFGRSHIFMERFTFKEQKSVYFSAVMFLYAAICSFIMSGWVYANTDKDFLGNGDLQSHIIGKYILLVSLALGVGISIIFSIAGIIFFFKWANSAFANASKDLKEVAGKENRF